MSGLTPTSIPTPANQSTGSRRQLLSVVVPCFNEQEAIEHSYRAIKDVLASLPDVDHELIFVDDGSADATLETLNAIMASDRAVRVHSLSRNFGHQIALAA